MAVDDTEELEGWLVEKSSHLKGTEEAVVELEDLQVM